MKEDSNKPQKGGKKRVFDIVVSGQDRAEHDFYATPLEAIPAVKWLVGIYEMPQCTARGTPMR